MKFNLGDKVYLKEDSKYYKSNYIMEGNPINTIGKITELYDQKYKVSWSNGKCNNGYNDTDLRLAGENNNINYEIY